EKFARTSCPKAIDLSLLNVPSITPSLPIEKSCNVPLVYPSCDVAVVLFGDATCVNNEPLPLYSFQSRVCADAPSTKPLMLIPVTSAAGAVRLPLPSKVRLPDCKLTVGLADPTSLPGI